MVMRADALMPSVVFHVQDELPPPGGSRRPTPDAYERNELQKTASEIQLPEFVPSARAAIASSARQCLLVVDLAGPVLPAGEKVSTLIRVTLTSVMTRKVTFNLPVDLLRQAKVYAAEHDTTVDVIVRELLQEKLTTESRARAATVRFLQLAARGPYSSVDPSSLRREDLYERE